MPRKKQRQKVPIRPVREVIQEEDSRAVGIYVGDKWYGEEWAGKCPGPPFCQGQDRYIHDPDGGLWVVKHTGGEHIQRHVK